jgi:cell division protein FtsQ
MGTGIFMSKKNNVYIKKAKRKRIVKRIIFFLVLFLIVAGFVIFKTDTFTVKSVECTGDNLLTGSFVTDKVQSANGKNIFTIDEADLEKELKENPYVNKVEFSKNYPNKLVVKITEASGLYYINEGSSFAIISKDLVLLERVTSIEGRELIEIKGIDIQGKNIGEKIDDSTRTEKLLDEFYKEEEVIRKNGENFSINAVEIGDLSQIKAYFGKITVFLGSDENIRTKMSNAIKVYKSGLVKEYINVSFEGSPSFK